MRRGTLAAFRTACAALALAGCAHLPGSPGGRGLAVRGDGFSGRLDRPSVPLPRRAAVLLLPPCLPALGPLAGRIAAAAADAGLLALSLDRGDPDPAIRWLARRGAERTFVLAAGCPPSEALAVVSGDDAAGAILLFPPRPPPASPLPLLLIDRAAAQSSQQLADRWELGFPIAEGASSPGPADERSLVEATALWLRDRSGD